MIWGTIEVRVRGVGVATSGVRIGGCAVASTSTIRGHTPIVRIRVGVGGGLRGELYWRGCDIGSVLSVVPVISVVPVVPVVSVISIVPIVSVVSGSRNGRKCNRQTKETTAPNVIGRSHIEIKPGF